MKTCSRCKTKKVTSEFYKDRARLDGLTYWCKECTKEQNRAYILANPEKAKKTRLAYRLANPEKVKGFGRAWYLANPERVKERNRAWRLANPERYRERSRALGLLRNHGISPEDYERILADQLGVCAVCGSDDPGRKNSKFFSIDHDHECCPSNRSCGRCIRGLVCHACNTFMGHAKDDPERLIAGANYLYRYIYRNSNSAKGGKHG